MALLTLLRVAAVAGTVYLTRELGVWREPQETENILENFKKEIKPYSDGLKKKMGIETKPKTWDEKAEEQYNQGLRKFFDALAQLPRYLRNFANDVSEVISCALFKPKED